MLPHRLRLRRGVGEVGEPRDDRVHVGIGQPVQPRHHDTERLRRVPSDPLVLVRERAEQPLRDGAARL
jgi:hypothetical protein